MKMDWKRKLSSRKFWQSLIGSIAGLVALFGGPAFTDEIVTQVATAIAGAAMVIVSVIAYLKAEKDIDVAREQAKKG